MDLAKAARRTSLGHLRVTGWRAPNEARRTPLSPASLFELRRARLRPKCVFGWLATRSPQGEGWCPVRDSNPQPPDYKSGALPIEPTGRACRASAQALSEMAGPDHSLGGHGFGGHGLGSAGRRAGAAGRGSIERIETKYNGDSGLILPARLTRVFASVRQLNTLDDFLTFQVKPGSPKRVCFSSLSLLRLMKCRLNLIGNCFNVLFTKGDGHAKRRPVEPRCAVLLGQGVTGCGRPRQAVATGCGER